MMNPQTAALLLLMIVFLNVSFQTSVLFYLRRMFLVILGLAFATVFLDILSCICLVWHYRISPYVTEFACKTYLVSIVSFFLSVLFYLIRDLFYRSLFRRVCIICGTVGGLVCVAIYLLPIAYYENGTTVYTAGPAVMIVYAFAALEVLVTLGLGFVHRKGINRSKSYALQQFFLICTGCGIYQFLHPEKLLVGFGISVGIVVLYLGIENPSHDVDSETRLYNAKAYMNYSHKKFEAGESFSIVEIILNMRQVNEKEFAQLHGVTQELSRFLEGVEGALAFHDDVQGYILVFGTKEKLYRGLAQVKERFKQSWHTFGTNMEVYIHPIYLVVEDNRIADHVGELIYTIINVKNEKLRVSRKDQYILTREDVMNTRAKISMEKQILEAIKEDRFEVYFQPIYSAREKRYTSAEALVRMLDPAGEVISPGRFIPLAEETGLIMDIGEIVFEKTCAFLKEHDIRKCGIDCIEINLSVVQCASEQLAERYIAIIEEYGIDASMINLEITETAAVVARGVLLKNMHRLIEHNVHFSLDDFGMGESNLNYILDMPVSNIKFDYKMTQSFFKNEKARHIYKHSLSMFHDICLNVISEGIETQDQLEEMTKIGVDYMQGFYFSHPVPADDFLDMIAPA